MIPSTQVNKGRVIKQQTRVNSQIRAKEVRVINDDGDQLGVMSIRDAMDRAEQEGLDLVEVSPQANPPVCKIVDWGKYNYRKTKQAQKNKKKQKSSEVKQMRFGLKIGDHDLETKMRKVSGFLDDGNKVKLSVFFRGREMAHKDLGGDLLEKAIDLLEQDVIVDQQPQMQGRYMTTMIRSK